MYNVFWEFGIEYGHGNDVSDDADEDSDSTECVEVTGLHSVCDAESNDDNFIYLSPHHLCSTHTLVYQTHRTH